MKLAVDEIHRRFKERGLKNTPQRTAIYQALAETTSHPTADDLYRQVVQLYPMISPNTVYYTLSVLRESGLVQEVNYWHDRTRFDANLTPHHHLICLECRTIQDLTDKELDRLALSSRIPRDFQIIGHRVEFHGYCGACQKQKKLKRNLHSKNHSPAKPKGRNS